MLCSFGSIWMIRLVHLSWDQCHFIQGRLRSWLQGRQAGWFRRWIAVCEGGTVGAAVGFAVGTAECEAEGPGFGSILVFGVGWPLKLCSSRVSKMSIVGWCSLTLPSSYWKTAIWILHFVLSKLIWLTSDAVKSRFLYPNIAKIVCLLQSQ